MSRINALLYIGVILYGCLPSTTKAYTYVDEDILRTSLFTGYNTDVRPVTPIDVSVTMILMSLNYLDIGAQEMCANVVVISMWHDSRLTWTPGSHNNIQNLVVKHGTVWLPTLVIENTVDDAGVFGVDEAAPQRIKYDGTVSWLSPAYARVSCNMKVTYFPFDRQTCRISVYGWSHDISEINLTAPAIPWFLTEYNENGEWTLDDTTVIDHLATDGVSTYKSLYFTVSFRRKWVFPFLSIIVPGVMNSILMCSVFYAPFEGTDKLAFSLTVLLSYYVILTYVSDTLPATSTNISILQAYLTFVMIAGTLSTLLSLWSVVIYFFDENKPIPHWVSYLYHNVASIFLCRKGSFQKIAKLCRSCRRRRNNASQVRQGSVTPMGHEGAGNSNVSMSTVTTGVSSSRELFWKGEGVEAMQVTQRSGQRGVIVKNTNEKSKEDELPTIHDMSIVSADSGLENSSKSSTGKEVKAMPVTIDENSSSNKRNPFIAFNQKQQENARCDDCEKCLSVDDDNYDDDVKELTWKMVAKTMDAVFFRVIGGGICLFTLILFILLIAQY